MEKMLFCFIHIERSGGTTLHYLLRKTFINYYSIPTYNGKYGEILNPCNFSRIISTLPFIKGVGGHTLRSYAGYEDSIKKPIFYITFLRDPIERYISQFNYILAHFNKNMSFDHYLSLHRFQNFQIKKICGYDNLQKGINEINRYGFVGLTDRFDESITFLSKNLGVNYINIKINKRNTIESTNLTKYLSPSDLTDKQFRKVTDNNKLDIDFYKYVEEQIFESQKTINFAQRRKINLSNNNLVKDYLIKINRLLIGQIFFDIILKKS